MFGFFLIPETRGKSADELSHFYRRRALAINPVDIMSTTMSLPGSRKSSELGTQPVGITGISLAWAGTGVQMSLLCGIWRLALLTLLRNGLYRVSSSDWCAVDCSEWWYRDLLSRSLFRLSILALAAALIFEA